MLNGSRTKLEAVEKRKYTLDPIGNWTPVVQSVAYHLTDRAPKNVKEEETEKITKETK
jgi:hypothetical protein